MSKKTEYANGQFSWVDLQTTDTDAAKSFYASVLGWDSKDVPTDMGPVYTMFVFNGLTVAGMGPQPPDMAAAGVPPVWSSYLNVDDCEATIAKAKELGANVMMPTMKIMEQGWLAFLQDPTGAAFGLWQPNAHHGAGWVNSVGGFCWNELCTNDVGKAKGFYEKLFGWEFSSSPTPNGEYWSITNRGSANGGMMAISPEWGDVPSHWGVYFTVESCSGAIGKIESMGGKVLLPPTPIPEVGMFAGVTDGQGAQFKVIELTGQKPA